MLKDEKNNYTQASFKHMGSLNKEFRLHAEEMIKEGFAIEEILYIAMTEITSVVTRLNIEKSIKILNDTKCKHENQSGAHQGTSICDDCGEKNGN